MYRRIFLIIEFFFMPLLTWAQSVNPNTLEWPHAIPRTPSVAALEKFGSYPVGYNTGTVNVSVPLFSIPLGDNLNLDLNLNYLTSGIRVGDIPGRVGAGWALNDGGFISREIRGLRDESNGNGFYHFIQGHNGYQLPANLVERESLMDSIERRQMELEPDLFHLQFLGRSYKFFLGNDGEFHTIPYSNIKFVSHPLTNNMGKGTWSIIDEQGNRFIFGRYNNVSAWETTDDPLSVPVNYTTAWKLRAILSPEGKELATFSYTDAPYGFAPYSEYTYRCINLQYVPIPPHGDPYLNLAPYQGLKSRIVYRNFEGCDLKGIHIPGKGDISVLSSSNTSDIPCHLISSISFADIHSNTLQRYDFSYTGGTRRYLSGITRIDAYGHQEAYRHFTYYPGLPDDYHSYGQDIWGYANGCSNTNLFPSSLGLIDSGNFNTADRYPNDQAKAGSLKEIHYPSGGKTCYEYENNYAFREDSSYTIQLTTENFHATGFGEHLSNIFHVSDDAATNITIQFGVSNPGLWEETIQIVDAMTGDIYASYSNLNLVSWNNLTPTGYNQAGDPIFSYQYPLSIPSGYYRWRVAYALSGLHYDESLLQPTNITYTYPKNIAVTNTNEEIAGGIRIKAITEYDADDTVIEQRTYSYLDDNGHSSGIAAPAPCFKRFYYESVEYAPNILGFTTFPLGIDEYCGDNLSGYSGSPAQYRTVTETTSNGSGTYSTRYNYRERPYIAPLLLSLMPEGSKYFPYKSNDYLEMLLLSKTVYKNNGSTNVKVYQENYQYDIDELNLNHRLFQALGVNVLCDSLIMQNTVHSPQEAFFKRFNFYTYDLISAKVLQTKYTTCYYANGDSIQEVTQNIYGNSKYINPTQRQHYVDSGDAETEQFLYSYDFPSDPTAGQLVSRNIIDKPLQVTHSYGGCSTSATTDYSSFAVSGTSFYEPSLYTITRNNENQTLAYLSYDGFGNPLHVVLNGHDHRYYLWSYQGRHPIAEIQMGSTTETEVRSAVSSVFNKTPEELSATTTPDTLKLQAGLLQSALAHALVSTYTYDPCGEIATVTDASGKTTRYSFDGFGRLKTVNVPFLSSGGALQSVPSETYAYHYRENGSQSNYVRSRSLLSPTGTDFLDQYTFYDGLGRPFETTLAEASPTGKDIVSLTEYQGLDREYHRWLPIAINSGGHQTDAASFKTSALASTLYDGDQRPFSEYTYEKSALDRITSQLGAGKEWYDKGKSVSTDELINSVSGTLSCLRYVMDGNMLRCLGAIPAGQLRVTMDTDEDGHIAYSFTDFRNHKILKRAVVGSQTCDTYYIYDGFGQLRCVLPPEASAALIGGSEWNTTSDATLLKYAYFYDYDGRGLCTQKKLPGAEKLLFRYDTLGRLAFSQDGNQRASNRWSFLLYDAFSRPTVTGIFVSATAPAVSGMSATAFTGSGTLGGYTSPLTALQASTTQLLSVNYYDTYSFLSLEPSATQTQLAYSAQAGYGTRYTNARGLLTGRRSYRLGTSTPSYSIEASYFDERDRLVQHHTTNHLGGFEHTYRQLSFTGKPLQLKHVHTATGQSTITENYGYTYDHAERLLTTTHTLNNGAPVTLATNTYDEVGRLSSKTLGCGEAITYKYNVRSWPTLISSNKFREQLIYNAEDYMGLLLDDSLRCYNGNAAMSIWRSPDQPWPRCYLYHYDALNRLTAADYSDGYALSNHLGGYSTAYNYDRHGNITAMQRYGQMDDGNFGLIDNLTFTYNGNQLRKVTDAAGSPTYTGVMDFTDGANSTAEYLYDGNGNATCDLNRGISSITYNLLDLPRLITFSSGNSIQYLYDAEGRKLNVTHSPPALSPSGQMTTDYCDNVIYKDGALERILTDEGYITIAANNTPAYHYYLRDHLGSVRVVLNGSGTVEETTHYYPYGITFPQTSVQPYKFCGKELDRMHGLDWYDSQARMYDPVLNRWHTQDGKAESYYSWSPYAYCAGNPVNYVDPDGNSVWTKIVKGVVKIGKQVIKHGAKALTEGATYAQAVADITDDINTLTDSEASTGSKVWAAISLASEAAPLSFNDLKDAGRIGKGASKKIKPNNGFSNPHGGDSHNDRIDKLIERLKRDPEVSNIRKNQRQVDINGNTVGKNRPDVQFDKHGQHTNVEYDTKIGSSKRHQKVIEQNDPEARNKFYIIR